jgi:hypothetical protein
LAPGPPAEHDEVELTPGPETGFVVLARRSVSFIKAGAMLAADSSGELRRIWHDYELEGPVPDAVGTPGMTCEESWYRFIPTSVYALGVRRDRMPTPRPIFAGPTRTVFPADTRKSEPVGACELQPPPAVRRPGVDSILSAPPPGSMSLQYMSDGTQVFVVRHIDSSIDVLAADTIGWSDRMESAWLRGLRIERGALLSARRPGASNVASRAQAAQASQFPNVPRPPSPRHRSRQRNFRNERSKLASGHREPLKSLGG